MNRDFAGGGLMILLGLGAVFEGRRHSIGSLTQMGTGYFPIILGVVLAGVGVAIVLNALAGRGGDTADELGMEVPLPDWRGCGAIVLGVGAFIVLGGLFGLAPGTFACVMISAMGDRTATLKSALLLSLSLTVVAVVGFWYILQVQFPVLQW